MNVVGEGWDGQRWEEGWQFSIQRHMNRSRRKEPQNLGLCIPGYAL